MDTERRATQCQPLGMIDFTSHDDGIGAAGDFAVEIVYLRPNWPRFQ
jgi:hypothetical protein